MKKTHELLSKQGIRLFDLSLGSDTTTLIHVSKTVEEWRNDLKSIIAELQNVKDEDGYSNDDVYNALFQKLRDIGYIDIHDIVSDVYEGRISVNSASICDDPAHEDQLNGFGHYGRESKN